MAIIVTSCCITIAIVISLEQLPISPPSSLWGQTEKLRELGCCCKCYLGVRILCGAQFNRTRGTIYWTKEWKSAFDIAQQAQVTAPVLAYPDYARPFILDADASDTGIGTVLSQWIPKEENTYASHTLSKPE